MGVMYAIVETQGQQFKVGEGRKLFVRHIYEVKQGAEVTLDRVMLLDKDGAVAVGAPTAGGAQVICEVVPPLVKGEEVLIFHKKRKRGYRKLKGHCQQFSEILVKQIVGQLKTLRNHGT